MANKLKTPTSRTGGPKPLAIRQRPYPGPSPARGVQLMYRRNKGAGSWVVKKADGTGKYSCKFLAIADDIEEANDSTVLDFQQAQDHALRVARGSKAVGKALNVRDALDLYKTDLIIRGGDPANARRVLPHLGALAGKLLALLVPTDFLDWRNRLIENGMSIANFNRIRTPLMAALRHVGGVNLEVLAGFKRVPGGNKARDMLLPHEGDPMRIVDAAYDIDWRFGVYVHVMAETGARPSQVSRLDCNDLLPNAIVNMPADRKGKVTAENAERRDPQPLPISAELAGNLAKMRGERGPGEPLLLNLKGVRWQSVDKSKPKGEQGHKADYRVPFNAAVESCGLDAVKFTAYCLRHTHIASQLIAGEQPLDVAQWHHTSVKEIELHYAKFLNKTDRAIEKARRTLPKRTGVVVRLPQAA